MSEKDYRASYITALGIDTSTRKVDSPRKVDIVDVHADVIDLEKIRHWLLVTPSSKLSNRAQIWEFLLGVIPRYKTVRLHTLDQLEEQWTVLANVAYLILSITLNHEITQYLFALHLIQTGQLTLMNEAQDISSGSPADDKADIHLLRGLLQLDSLKYRKPFAQYFIVHEILVLLGSLNREQKVVRQICDKLSRTDMGLARKLNRSNEAKQSLSMLVRSCFAKILPGCCFGKLLDIIIATRDITSLVTVGIVCVTENAPNLDAMKITKLYTQPHVHCFATN